MLHAARVRTGGRQHLPRIPDYRHAHPHVPRLLHHQGKGGGVEAANREWPGPLLIHLVYWEAQVASTALGGGPYPSLGPSGGRQG